MQLSPPVSPHVPTMAMSMVSSMSANRSPSGEYARVSATGGGVRGQGYLSPEMALAGGWSDDGGDDEEEGENVGVQAK